MECSNSSSTCGDSVQHKYSRGQSWYWDWFLQTHNWANLRCEVGQAVYQSVYQFIHHYLFGWRWLVMKDVLSVFSDLSVPFTLEGGSLLHLVRNCNLGGSDLDFVLQLGWLNQTNTHQLELALKSKGLERSSSHGVREHLGYEESWRRGDVKECSCLVMFGK